MTIRKSHLQIALAVLVVSLGYSFWVYLRPARSGQASTLDPGSLEAQIAQASQGGTFGGSGDAPRARPVSGVTSSQQAADPASIPAPPPVDLATPPTWARDPFLFGSETRAGTARVAAAASPDPVVKSILFSSNRRLAVVDGKIVGIGDAIGAGRVVDITREAVVITTPAGAQRRLTLRVQSAAAGIKR